MVEKLRIGRAHTRRAVVFMAIFGLIGIVVMLYASAATPRVDFEVEAVGDKLGVSTESDASASGGQYVRFSSGEGDYYVDPAGSDSNPGTAEAPFRTIQKAADVVMPGQVVIVRDGVYADPGSDDCSPATIVCVKRGGNATAGPVVFKSANKWGAKLDGQNGTTANGFTLRADYVRIEGFEIYGFGNTGGSSSGIEIYSGGANSQIVANNIHDIGRMCTQTNNGQVGVFVERNGVTIERNFIHDIGRYAPGESGCSYPGGYTGYQSHDHGIYINGNSGTRQDITVQNNIFAGFRRGWAVQIYPGMLQNITIHNNTFAYGNPYRQYTSIIIYQVTLSNASIRNNIFYNPEGGRAISVGGTLSLSNVVVSNNLMSASAVLDAAVPSGISLDSNVLDTSAQFVSASPPYDFRLQEGSRARNAGAELPGTTDDFDGTVRPQGSGYDIGAFEQN